MPRDHREPGAPLRRECRDTYDRWELFASSRLGTRLMFAWALAEATVWPILPDFLLIPMVAANRRRFHVPLAAAVTGMAVGGATTVLFAYRAPRHAWGLLRHLPLVHEQQIDVARRHLAAHGTAAFLFQPWSGVPSKIWAVVAGAERPNPWLAIPALVIGRSLRMAVLAGAARLLAGRFAGAVRDHSIFLAATYVTVFSVGLWRISRPTRQAFRDSRVRCAPHAVGGLHTPRTPS
jgi:membrane protein YqaA with SNARE-associated domain